MQDEVATEEVGQAEPGENVDAMPEEAPDQAPGAPAEVVPEVPAETVPEEGAPPAFSLDGLTPEQVEAWKKDSENRHNWQKTNTQEAQRVAEERKSLVYQQNQMQAFQNDPVTRALWEARQRIEQNPELLADLERFKAGTAQPGQQPDPLVNKLFGQVQTLTQQMAQNQWQAEEQVRGENALAAKKAVDVFRKEHKDVFPPGDEGDAKFGVFMDTTYYPSGVADLETAWKISDYDNAQARARQSAQAEVAAVDTEKAEAAGTVVPGSHTPDVVAGDPWDTNFEGARARSMSRYDLGFTED